MIFFKKKKQSSYPDVKSEIKHLTSLDKKIEFTHEIYGKKHKELFWEMKSWYIEALKLDFPDEWEDKIGSFDNWIIKEKDDEPKIVHFINKTILSLYHHHTITNKTNNKWNKKEAKSYADFIIFLIESSEKYYLAGQIPPNLGGISHIDVPEWFKAWAKSQKITYLEY